MTKPKIETRAGAATTFLVAVGTLLLILADGLWWSRVLWLVPGVVPVMLYGFVSMQVASMIGGAAGIAVDAWVLVGRDQRAGR